MSKRRTYDHRIREEICRTGDPHLFPEARVPRTTAASWIRRGARSVVTLERTTRPDAQLRERITTLERRIATLHAVVVLLITVTRVAGTDLERLRFPKASDKSKLLRAVQSASRVLSIATATRVMGISSSRFYAWRQSERACGLEDALTCPSASPNRMTPREVLAMKEMVLSEEYRHMSVRSLALLAQRLGRVFAHPVTWYKMIRERDWFRPRTRIYPEPVKVGLRTTGTNQAWHVDVTVVRLLGGVRVYVQAVIDNYSRRILSWAVTEKLRGLGTVEVIAAAGRNVGSESAVRVVMDAGTENVNQYVSSELDVKGFERVIAQVDVEYSNSMIEAWWRSLRHNWLYLHSLTNVEQLERLVGFYVDQHNKVMPHSAFDGQTPDEVFFGKYSTVEAKIQRERARALKQRLAENRGLRCSACPRPPPEAQGRAA